MSCYLPLSPPTALSFAKKAKGAIEAARRKQAEEEIKEFQDWANASVWRRFWHGPPRWRFWEPLTFEDARRTPRPYFYYLRPPQFDKQLRAAENLISMLGHGLADAFPDVTVYVDAADFEGIKYTLRPDAPEKKEA